MSTIDWVFFHTAVALFAAATVLGIVGARSGRRGPVAATRAALLGAVIALGFMLARHGMESGAFPVANRFDALVFSCATLALLALTLDLVRGLPILSVGAAPFCFMDALVAATLGMPTAGATAPASAWVGLHVVATLISYGLFALAFIAALLYLVEQRQLKSGTSTSLLGLMPSLETFYRLLLGSLGGGVALLTVGLVVGYLFARRQGLPEGWRTDPKVILTTVTWVAYLLVYALSFTRALKGRRGALASMGCFFFVMTTFWATAFWTGFHKYV